MEGLTLIPIERVYDSIHGGTITDIIVTEDHLDLTIEAKDAPTILLRAPLHDYYPIQAIVIDDNPAPQEKGQISIYDCLEEGKATPPENLGEFDPTKARTEDHHHHGRRHEVRHKTGCHTRAEWYIVCDELRGVCTACDTLSTETAR